MSMKLIPVVLSGGSGTRLWPMSRTTYPKQFCPLLDKSLQTLTLERLQKYEPSLVVTSEKLMNLTKKEIVENKFAIHHVIYEPQGKNTAAAIAVACRFLELQNLQDEVVGVFSSDALITNPEAFHEAIDVATKTAKENKIVILGIRPDRIETGFGYIQVNDPKLNKASSVLKFHEKPSYELATKFIQDGRFFWNAGIFIFKISQLIKHFQTYLPELWKEVSKLKADLSNLAAVYQAVPSVSIDVGLLEKLDAENLSCVPCTIGWSDLGSWDVLEQIGSKTVDAGADGDSLNHLSKPTFEVESQGNAVFSNEKKVYGLVGVDDLIIVDTDDALMICKKGESQKVKNLVDMVKAKVPTVIDMHNFEMRPWGRFEIIKEEDHYKSKIIRVEPGQRLSYQSHQFRAEHWVVVKGTATVILNDEQHEIKQGQHIFIPKGAKHRLINNTKEMVEFIEVQVGQSFDEGDITRYQDDYGR